MCRGVPVRVLAEASAGERRSSQEGASRYVGAPGVSRRLQEHTFCLSPRPRQSPALTCSFRLPYRERRRFPSGINRERGEARDRQCRGCPRNCKRRIFRHHATGLSGPGKAAEGSDPRARRPAVSRGHTRACRPGCADRAEPARTVVRLVRLRSQVTCHKRRARGLVCFPSPSRHIVPQDSALFSSHRPYSFLWGLSVPRPLSRSRARPQT